jgi:hypothetical protein
MPDISRRNALKYAALAAVAIGCTPTKVPNVTKRKKPDFPFKLGKHPASHTAKLQLRDYLKPHLLPEVPQDFGHELLVGTDWGVFGNAQWGDCAIAGPYHSLQLWNAEGANTINICDQTVLESYSLVTGFDQSAGPSGSNQTDNGTNMTVMADYWQKIGFKDDDGNVHKIDGYVALEPGNIEQLWAAAYLFDGLGIGIRFPEEWMTAFNRSAEWDAVTSPHIEGGHYVTGVARRGGNLVVVTWGGLQQMTPAGYEQFNDEAFIYVDTDKLIQGKDINGLDLKSLREDMWAVSQCHEEPN